VRSVVEACGGERLALLTLEPADPAGYGRVLRQGDAVLGIVEHRDATPAQRQIPEVYTGVMAAPTARLKRWVAALRNDNAQREYYLTDVVAMAVGSSWPRSSPSWSAGCSAARRTR
jgi:bifunctional UDP-N-acetylglucosamine pyrophosphorylase / glucosamine-1-phosphate N-acetyltransferase